MQEPNPGKLKGHKIEKPPFLYHGSVTPDIEELEPRRRHTPSAEAGERIYAGLLPGWAAAHSFSWSSPEGFNTYVEDAGTVVLEVPKGEEKRLQVPVYIYKVSGEKFNFTEDERTGNTFHSTEKVRPLSVEKFNSVTEALVHFGGKVVFVD